MIDNSEERSAIAKLLSPDRVLLFATMIFVAGIVSLIVFYIFRQNVPQPSLGAYQSPQAVLRCKTLEPSSCMPLIPYDGIGALYMGDVVGIQGLRCVNSEHPINVLTYRNFSRVVQQDERPTTVAASTRVRESVRKTGDTCDPILTMVAMPVSLEPGRWRLDGIDFSTKDGIIRIWTTEDFQILPEGS